MVPVVAVGPFEAFEANVPAATGAAGDDDGDTEARILSNELYRPAKLFDG